MTSDGGPLADGDISTYLFSSLKRLNCLSQVEKFLSSVSYYCDSWIHHTPAADSAWEATPRLESTLGGLLESLHKSQDVSHN